MTELETFREVLLSHARAPRHVGRLESDLVLHGRCTNPLCGDTVSLTLIVEAHRVDQIKSQSAGCSMSIASASMMCDLVEGKDLGEIESLRTALSEALLQSPGSAWPVTLEALRPFIHLRESPTRVPCVLMGWFALKDALAKAPQS